MTVCSRARTTKKASRRAKEPTPPHIPEYPCNNKSAYRQLYHENDYCWGPSFCVAKWRRVLIPSNITTEIGVYRLLPNAPDFEYGGWITRRGIFYARGTEDKAYSNDSVGTAFHSHPTQHEYADVPSARDVYGLLKWPTVRRVIVGRRYIVVLEKTARTLAMVAKLFEWEPRHMVPTIRSLCAGDAWISSYCDIVLHRLIGAGSIGVEDYVRDWVSLLRKNLKIRVRRFARKQGEVP